MASYFIARGYSLQGTETRIQGDEDRVHLLFDIENDKLMELKREFFEGASAPALDILNIHKSVMHAIREARELARESR